ncbi:MAG: glycoside hydrolase family 3 C-terminal domain-containing protein [Clostridia bacterium]|nr:glycoside hydrolase family 3 C-terminal domain-containing protein [Clostridia bacterium]
MSKKNLWRGLIYVFTLLLALVIIASVLLESFSSAVDAYLGTQSYKVLTKEDKDSTYKLFTPDEKYLNEDGTGNSKALISAAIDLGRRQSQEGSVLLKNNGALPLSSGDKITMLGMRSVYTLLGCEMGMRVSGAVIPLKDAFTRTTTDFKNQENWISDGDFSKLDDFDIDGAGFSVNQTMIEAYQSINAIYKSQRKEMTMLDTLSEVYNPNEPSIADLEEVSPNFESSFASFNDAAIVVLGRPSSEGVDYLPGGIVEGLGATEPLELTDNERSAVKLATDNFDKVVILINTASPMEIKELEENNKVDAILWIGYPGSYGSLGIADILCGRKAPSGALADTYATKNMSAPAMMNMGKFRFTNANELSRSKSANYLMEAESIYVGYRYYETRYYDCVIGEGNANSTAGAVASNGAWNYAEEVVYPFGYGLSYTTFTQEFVGEPVINKGEHEFTFTFKVKITNTGNVAGKSIVQIYGQAPYIHGQTTVEKSAIVLLAFDKTKELQPNESQEITVEVDMQNFASYDESYKHADGNFGGYILDKGNYYFALGNGSHEAVNNVLAKQGKTKENSQMDENGNADKVFVWENSQFDAETFSVSKTGERVFNQLDYANWNNFEGAEKIEQLSRSNWQDTYPKSYQVAFPQSMKDYLNGYYYTPTNTGDLSNIVWNNKDSNLKFYQLANAEYDDERWEQLLSQMSMEESMLLICFGGPTLPEVKSIDFYSLYLAENCGNGFVFALNNSKDKEAPWTIAASDNNANWNCQVFASAPLLASTFNPELFKEQGEMLGNQSLFLGLPLLWGPGLNTHRHAYNGRNGEYYSEDPVLCGVIAMEYAVAALDYGLIIAPKHFAFNDQETNRQGVAPFMTEQRAREIELKAYQLAVEATKYDKLLAKDVGMSGLMTSFSKIGAVECTCSYELMTNILQKEWGFHGYAVTDIFDDTDRYVSVAHSGVTGFDIRGASGKNMTLSYNFFKSQVGNLSVNPSAYSKDEGLQTSLKRASKNLMWALCNSNLMNRYAISTTYEWQMTSWRMAYRVAIGVSATLLVGAITMYVLSEIFTRRNKDEN